MTKKRFTITQDFEEHHRQIRDNGHIIMGCFVEPQAEVIVDLLNELSDENEQLRKELENNIASYKKCNRRVFDLIDKKIKEVDTIGAEVLKDLRRELME